MNRYIFFLKSDLCIRFRWGWSIRHNLEYIVRIFNDNAWVFKITWYRTAWLIWLVPFFIVASNFQVFIIFIFFYYYVKLFFIETYFCILKLGHEQLFSFIKSNLLLSIPNSFNMLCYKSSWFIDRKNFNYSL